MQNQSLREEELKKGVFASPIKSEDRSRSMVDDFQLKVSGW